MQFKKLFSALAVSMAIAGCSQTQESVAAEPEPQAQPEPQVTNEIQPADYGPNPEDYQVRLMELSEQKDIPLSDLEAAIGQAKLDPEILERIQRPWEAKPWHEYYPIFLRQDRIEAGGEFWAEHADTLARAEQEFGVPAEIIVAIIGVETRFGTYMGTFPVLDSLYTLGFHYPRRAQFFSSEFAEYVRLASREGWDLRDVNGSYAGAMGMGQFISSSYLAYGIDFDGDDKVDLFGSTEDAIGSVANYFARHGWTADEPVVHRAHVDHQIPEKLMPKSLKPQQTWSELASAGVLIREGQNLDGDTKVRLLKLDGKEADEFWVTENNFYVITRYNHSPLYAMAVYQLSQAIKAEHQGQMTAAN